MINLVLNFQGFKLIKKSIIYIFYRKKLKNLKIINVYKQLEKCQNILKIFYLYLYSTKNSSLNVG